LTSETYRFKAAVITGGETMPILEQIRQFSDRFGKKTMVNDTNQNKKDFPRYEKLLGRSVEVLTLGHMGHVAALFNPDKYVEILEQALG
jgi:hypothetical protein